MMNITMQSILEYSDKYAYEVGQSDDFSIETKMKSKLSGQPCLSRDDYITIGRWKSKRPTKHYENNTADYVREISEIAFHTGNEKIKIEILTLLNGCNYPLASVILHFKYPNLYPIIDFRAIWSLWGENPPTQYTFEYWWKYVEQIRAISQRFSLDLRTIDKALWQYSKENQL